MRYVESLNAALHGLMAADPRVYLIGEDVLDPYGGAFKVARGLSTAYPDRVVTTPISEAALAGVGIGMAMRGMRPVVEIMFGDFLALCADQIVNHAAKFRAMYGNGVQVPLVIRTPMGGYRCYGATHSQSLEAMFMGVPGLSIASPSLFHDPGALLSRCVREEVDPVLFVEHKILYPQPVFASGEALHGLPVHAVWECADAPLPTARLTVAPDEAPDVTIIAYGAAASMAAEAAVAAFVGEEVVAEVVVPSRLRPLPLGDLLPAARRSRRVVVVEEGPRTGGWGAEVSSRLHEDLFSVLEAPVVRIGAADAPIPCARDLEAAVLPSVSQITKAVLTLGGTPTSTPIELPRASSIAVGPSES